MTQDLRPGWRPRLDGLAPRVAAYLSLALLPLGLIAIYQTREFQQETEERAELSLLALTEQGATGVGSAIERALGAGEALGALAVLLDDPATCSRILRRLVDGPNPFAFAGLLPAEGPVTCSSVGQSFDLDPETQAEMADLVARPRLVVRPSRSQQDELVIGMPLAPETPEIGEVPGYLALSIPHDRIHAGVPGAAALRPLRLLTFSVDGEVLTGGGSAGETPLEALLPQGVALADLGSEIPRAFADRSAQGTDQIYTLAPLVPGVAYILGIWSPEQAARSGGGPREWPLLFPLLMWVTSLVVAFWAIHNLVIRRVRTLVARMHRFGRDRSLPPAPANSGTPHELRAIEDAFRQTASSILEDEARMENAFRERGVLLREVHHRVKNNLQLISSIISMQMRRLPEPATRAILRRLQDRVLTLASIYRSLYTSPDMGDVNAAPVLRAIVEQELRADQGRVEATLDIEDMVLDPDKVVPVAFLAAEAVSNALARASAADGGRPSLSVSLHRDGEQARLSIVNSLDGPVAPQEPARGLGQHLIHAFASQVGGPVEIDTDDRLYRLSIAFPLDSPAEEPVPA